MHFVSFRRPRDYRSHHRLIIHYRRFSFFFFIILILFLERFSSMSVFFSFSQVLIKYIEHLSCKTNVRFYLLM